MKLSSSPLGRRPNILAANHFLSIPVCIAGNQVVPAGMPVTSDGLPAPNGSGAVGILLYDVDPTVNPNAAAVVHGVVDWTKCQTLSGASADAATMSSLLPGITFRDNPPLMLNSVRFLL